MSVAFVRGKQLGTIEEDFVNRFRTGDVFLFAGRALQLQYVKDNTAFVRESPGTKGAIARWMGGRIPLSTQMSTVLRRTLNEAAHGEYLTPELQRIRPLLELQQELSALPKQNELLIECYTSREGYHAFVYPFEGRLAHEGLSALLAYRISKQQPITFSMAMNDYGFELLSDQPWFPREWEGLFQLTNLSNDILNSANASALSRRRFREIARIAGLIFQGYPGKPKKARHLQASSNLLYDVFRDYDPGNLLLQQSSAETLTFQLDEERIQSALRRLKNSAIVVKHITSPTPLCSPILADRLRETLGSERMEERLRRLIAGKVS